MQIISQDIFMERLIVIKALELYMISAFDFYSPSRKFFKPLGFVFFVFIERRRKYYLLYIFEIHDFIPSGSGKSGALALLFVSRRKVYRVKQITAKQYQREIISRNHQDQKSKYTQYPEKHSRHSRKCDMRQVFRQCDFHDDLEYPSPVKASDGK
jgi:hypothetical protein